MGDYWESAGLAATFSPYPPSNGIDYYSFSMNYSVSGFGNEQSTGDSFFSNGTISWLSDPLSYD